MIKRENLAFFFVVLVGITLPIVAFPALVRSNPTEFPILSKFYNRQSNLNSSKNDRPTKTISALELQESIEAGSSECVRAALTLSSPFGAFYGKMHDWISEAWNRNSTKENKI